MVSIVPTFSRRRFLAVSGLGLWGVQIQPNAAEPETAWASFDREMIEFMRVRNVPGGSLAVGRNGRLLYAKDYGFADRDKKTPVVTKSLFRIASLSKPVTAVAILKLAQENKLRLDDKALDLLKMEPLPGRKMDERLSRITVRQLLQHTAGWDRDKSGDPMFMSSKIALAAGVACPPGPEPIIRYMLGRPLDFDPGTRYSYSNFGYCLLGRIVEKITGKGYEDYVRTAVLAQAGIQDMRIGGSLESQSATDEVRYYTVGDQKENSLFPATDKTVPTPYGAFHLESMDAHGGWIASASSLVRFMNALEAEGNVGLLKPDSFKAMIALPAAPVGRDKEGKAQDVFYGCGWQVRRLGGSESKVNLWHTGSLPGTFTFMARLASGFCWAALFNQRQQGSENPDGAIDGALHRAAAGLKLP